MKRTSEKQMALEIVRLLKRSPEHRATIAEIIHLLPRWASLSKGDLQLSPSRPGERRFHQIIRNIRSHDSGARYGLHLTDDGFSLNVRPSKAVLTTLANIARTSRQARRAVQ